MVIVDVALERSPIAAMASPRIPTSARYRALPVPSMMSPWTMRMSYVTAFGFGVADLLGEAGPAAVQVRARRRTNVKRIAVDSCKRESRHISRSFGVRWRRATALGGAVESRLFT